ncbi:hypothetical protein E3N88_27712 [Mikania micrantha]|uniref:Uncharacterized protein n=1 Tax=Mikania micrantha TaxID=192012 RepID=A0A5N6MY04_9ASTR|nr:hypothetical protein E3N88_27712 [Mikania micrantha]
MDDDEGKGLGDTSLRVLSRREESISTTWMTGGCEAWVIQQFDESCNGFDLFLAVGYEGWFYGTINGW